MKKIIILQDNQATFNDNKRGIKNYFSGINSNINPNNIKVIQVPSLKFPEKNLSFFLNKIISIFYIVFIKYDLFVPTYYNNYFMRFNKKKFILYVYDLITEISNLDIHKKTTINKYNLISKASQIIAISNKTKNDIQSHIGYKKNINVVYPSSSLSLTRQVKSVEIINNKKFILFVGNRMLKYKNFIKTLISIKKILIEEKITLFCAGGGQFSFNEKRIIRKLNLENLVLQKDLSKEELKWSYQNCMLFLFPSLHEGFGLPIIEAQSNKCLVVCSDTKIFREICGKNSVIFFKTNDPNSLEDKIRFALEIDEKQIKKILQNGLLNSKRYSWKKSANKVEKIYIKTFFSQPV